MSGCVKHFSFVDSRSCPAVRFSHEREQSFTLKNNIFLTLHITKHSRSEHVRVGLGTTPNLCFMFFQVIVWGDYGRMDHKCFMGVAQILLEELDLSSVVIGWYKLFPPSSLVDPTLTPLTRRASQSSLESSTGPPCIRS